MRRISAPVPHVSKLFHLKPTDDCSKAYRNMCEPSSDRATRARWLCEEMWRDFYDLADPQFCERFPLEFHQRWFEMYLGVSLRRAGLNISAPKPGPDFRVEVEGSPIYIEAVAPTGGNPFHADVVGEPVYHEIDGTPRALQIPYTKITLRIADVFRRKADVFDEYRHKGYVSAGDPCIVAINLHDIPHAWPDAEEYWFRAFYGVGDMFIWVDRTGHATTTGREHRKLLTRASGAKEDVAPLLNTDRAGISGVLGSVADVGNVPNPVGDDLLLMPHAAAHSPYPQGLIKRGTELVLQAAENGQHWDVKTIDYGAHEARGPVAFAVNFEGVAYKGEWSIAGQNLSVRVGSRRSVLPIQAGDDPAALAEQKAVEILSVLCSQRR